MSQHHHSAILYIEPWNRNHRLTPSPPNTSQHLPTPPTRHLCSFRVQPAISLPRVDCLYWLMGKPATSLPPHQNQKKERHTHTKRQEKETGRKSKIEKRNCVSLHSVRRLFDRVAVYPLTSGPHAHDKNRIFLPLFAMDRETKRRDTGASPGKKNPAGSSLLPASPPLPNPNSARRVEAKCCITSRVSVISR